MSLTGVVLASDSSSSSDDDDSDTSIRGLNYSSERPVQSAAGSSHESPFQADYGIGARLMASMGYKPGKGLGVTESGRAEPIEQIGTKGKRGLGAIPQEWSDDEPSIPTENIPAKKGFQTEDEIKLFEAKQQKQKDKLRQDKLQTIYRRTQDELHKITTELDAVQRLARTLAATPAGELDLLDLYAEFGQVWDLLQLQDVAVAVITAWLRERPADDVGMLRKINECRYTLDEEALQAVLRAYWLPKVKLACTPWTEEASVWIGNLLLDLRDAPDLQTLITDDLDRLLASLAVMSGEFDEGLVAYIDEWWPDSSPALGRVVEILETGFKPELVSKASLDSWQQLHPDLAAALDRVFRSQIQSDFDNGVDTYARWSILGDTLDNILDSIWADKLVNLSLQSPSQLQPQLERWHDWTTEKGRKNGRILDGINVALDGSTRGGAEEVWEAVDSAGKVLHEAVRATFKDVVEQHCQNLGLYFVRQPTTPQEYAHYWISRTPEPTAAAISCHIADDVLYVDRDGFTGPVSVRDLCSLNI